MQLSVIFKMSIFVSMQTFQYSDSGKVILQYIAYNNITIVKSLDVILDNWWIYADGFQ